MSEPEDFIPFKNHQIHYHKFGVGKKTLLAFHGFGQSGSAFSSIAQSLGKQFTLYSFDLLHHGKSVYTGAPINPSDLKEIVEVFLEKEAIENFSVIGFSLGGKIAFKTVEFFPQQIEYAFLLAPDGMKINPFYQFVSYTKAGASIYNLTVKYPNPFLNALNFFKNIRLIGERLHRFVFEQMNTRHKRELVLKTWITFRELNPDLKEIQRIINEEAIDFHLFIGKRDRVIPLRFSTKLMTGIRDKKKLHLIETGHSMLTRKVGELILSEIKA